MTRFFLRRPVSTWMIFTAFVVLGIYALPRLKIEAIPEIDLPKLTIVTAWGGASPQAVQRSITLPIEQAARHVHGVESVKSTSRAGNSTVEVEFRREIDIDFARLELAEQLGAVRRDLPVGAGQPQVVPYVPEEFRTEDFFAFNIVSDLPADALREEAETWILPQVLAIEGVADARVQGGARPILKILLDRERLERHGIPAEEVYSAVAALDEVSGAGVVRTSGIETLVALREPVDLRSLRAAVVARRGDRSYRLGDLAEIRPGYEDPDYFVRADGRNVVQVAVDKRSGANTVAVSRDLRNSLPRIERQIPFEALLSVRDDQGKDLEEKLVELVYRSLVILALLFALLAATLRRIRLTAIVIGSILFAVVISLSLFYFLKLSVNFITISGLTVSFGLLLDNSILVLDAIHRRLSALDRAEREGLSRTARMRIAAQTVIAGTREVAFPIVATTATTVVAFVSFIFLSGRLSLYYVPLAVAVTTAMFASLFVAFAWLPVVLNQGWTRSVAARAGAGGRDLEEDAQVERYVEETAAIEDPPRGIERLVQTAARLWWLVLPAVAAFLLWGGQVYDKKVIKGGFWQIPDPQELFLYLEMPPGTDVAVTSATLAGFERILLPAPEGAEMQSMAWGNQAYLRIDFEDALLSTHFPIYFRQLLAEQADRTGGTTVFIRGFSDQPYFKGTFGGSALNSLIKLTGYNSRRLNEIAEGTRLRAERSRRVRNTRITTGERFALATQEEAVVTVDRRRLAEYDLDLPEVILHLRRLTGIDTPWSMRIEGDQKRVQLVYGDSESIDYSDVAGHVMTTGSGERVRLGDLLDLSMRPLTGPIVRENQRYAMHVNWEYIGTDRMRRAYLREILEGIDLPYGYHAEEAQREFFTPEEEEELTLMIVLAAVFIFMVLAALFESLTLPLLVMASLPMALVGVVLLFWLTSSSFDSSARIGLVLLFGIVVNNAILLVSRFRIEASLLLKARLGGDPEAEAALFAGSRKRLGGSDLRLLPPEERGRMLLRAVGRGTRIRLRSILLTSGTTIVGLAPLLVRFRKGEGTDIWENLALSSIGGLASSTVLILLAMPPLYVLAVRFGWLLDRLGGGIRSRRSGRRGGAFARDPVS